MKGWVKLGLNKILRRIGFEIRRTTSSSSAHSFGHTFKRLKVMRDLGFHPHTICDVGASDGRWSRKCLKIFPKAQYFCIDPLEENQPCLAQCRAKYPSVSYWQGCFGPKTGTVLLNVDGAGSSILPGHFGNRYGIQREVPLETLDNLILQGSCSYPDLLKLDVQGYELEVLKGATSALREVQAAIAEVSFFPFQSGMPGFHEVVGQLAEYGFIVYDVLGLSLRPLDGAAGQTNLLFLRATHPLRSSNQWDHNSVY